MTEIDLLSYAVFVGGSTKCLGEDVEEEDEEDEDGEKEDEEKKQKDKKKIHTVKYPKGVKPYFLWEDEIISFSKNTDNITKLSKELAIKDNYIVFKCKSASLAFATIPKLAELDYCIELSASKIQKMKYIQSNVFGNILVVYLIIEEGDDDEDDEE